MANQLITSLEFEKQSNIVLEAGIRALKNKRTGLEKILSKTYRTDELWVKDFHLDKNIDNQQKQDYFNVIP